jgi:DNA-binding NarL/FixJ family response regulator
VLMDIRMPVLNGLEATRLILEGADPDGPPRIVVLTTIRKDEAVVAALQAGASAFLTKDAEPDVVLATIRAAHAGAPSPTFADTVALVEEFVPALSTPTPSSDDDGPDPLAALTSREREMLLHVARGRSNAEIATELFVSEATVKTHVRALLQKLGLRSRIQIVIFAYEHGLVSGPPAALSSSSSAASSRHSHPQES